MSGLFGKPIKVSQGIIKNNFQTWLETIVLLDDKEADRLNGWTVGFYHCKHCETYQGFAYRIPPLESADHSGELTYQPVNAEAHNDRNAFWRAHAHGDGRVLLFEKDMPVLQPPTHAIIEVYMESGEGGILVHTTPPLDLGRGSNPTITFGVIVKFGVIIKQMREQNELLRSAHEIAKRKGVDTNWEAFENNVRNELLRQAGVPESTDEQETLRATVTPKTYRIYPSD